jgi:hypothetical protein
MWDVSTTNEFEAWFEVLDDEAKIEVIAKVTLLRQLGPALPRPHADTLKGSKHSNLKELRANTSDQVLRIAFAFDPTRTAIVLIGGDKSGMSQPLFYRRLIARADRLYDEHLVQLRKRKS